MSPQALIQASTAHENHLLPYNQIYLSTTGILFLGTPHQGTDVVPKLLSLCRRPNKILLQHLVSNSELLQKQIADFTAIALKFHTTFFYETLETNIDDSFSLVSLGMLIYSRSLKHYIYLDCS